LCQHCVDFVNLTHGDGSRVLLLSYGKAVMILPRKPRQFSKTGIYHIIVRGINQQDIFHEDSDFAKYLGAVKKLGAECGITVLGYCLMSNHAHLLLMENGYNISDYMKRLGSNYAQWYNRKYERRGPLFQDRFRSECVEDEAYLLAVIRYIHNNPVRAGIVSSPEKYRWSSGASYLKTGDNADGVDTRYILDILSTNRRVSLKQFREFSQEDIADRCLEHKNPRPSDSEAYRRLVDLLQGQPATVLQDMDKKTRQQLLRTMKHEHRVGLRQLVRITGLPLHELRKI
jgi:putative transposase